MPYSAQASVGASYQEVRAAFGQISILKENCIQDIWERIPPRDVQADRNVQDLVRSKIKLYDGDYIILDSGHAHSVAASIALIERGYMPEYYFSAHVNKLSLKKNLGISIQVVAAMKFYASRVNSLKQAAIVNQVLKRATVLDTHRTSRISKYSFPDQQELMHKYFGRVTWITEKLEGLKNNYVTYNNSNKDLLRASFRRFQSIENQVRAYSNMKEVIFSQHFADPYYDHKEGVGYDSYSVSLAKGVMPKSCSEWEL